MKTLTKVVTSLGSLATLVSLAPVASAASSDPMYQHGAYAKSHYSTLDSCNTARSAAITALSNYSATSIDPGDCHPIDAKTSAGLAEKGFVFDITYRRYQQVYWGDTEVGSDGGAHSFKVNGNYSTQSAAAAAEAANAVKLNTGGSKVTWRSGVVQNALTKMWTYEIDYTARKPAYWAHTEISESPNVTTPSLGIKVIAPTSPNAGTASMGGTTKPSTPATPPGTITTPGTKTSTSGTVTSTTTNEPIGVQGIDISGYTRVNDWSGWSQAGVKFLWAKVSEGTYYTNPQFNAQSTGAANAGIVWGAYHFATPNTSTGTQQADYAIAHGGGWKAGNNQLPLAVDMEWNPYGNMCYSMTKAQINTFISDFENEYRRVTGAYAPIYTATAWWNTCVGSAYTGPNVPLWLANYGKSAGAMPTSWSSNMVWQNGALTSKGYDTDVFNGTMTQLRRYANTGVASS